MSPRRLHQPIRMLLLGLILLPAILSGSRADIATAEALAVRPFLGTWQTTSATTSILLEIKPGGEVLNILTEAGSQGIVHDVWKPLPGGLLVDGMPRFRIWKGRHKDEVRVEMEPLPADLTSEGLQQFPLTFFMKRTDHKHQIPAAVANRELPVHWKDSALPGGWDETAGTRRALQK